MTDKQQKIEGTEENWESGKLGETAGTARKAKISQARIDEALDLKPISIRLEQNLIDDFKAFSQIYGIGYQPLIRQVLTKFAEGEKKMLYKKHLEKMAKDSSAGDAQEGGSTSGDDDRVVA